MSSRWHRPHTITSGRETLPEVVSSLSRDLKVKQIKNGSPGPSGQQQRTSVSFQGTSVTEDDADPDSKAGRKPVPNMCTTAADSSKQTQPGQAGCHQKYHAYIFAYKSSHMTNHLMASAWKKREVRNLGLWTTSDLLNKEGWRNNCQGQKFLNGRWRRKEGELE